MKQEFAEKCLPTFEMIEKALLKGEKFNSKVNEKLEENAKNLKVENGNLKSEVGHFSDRIVELEKVVTEGSTCSC
jgi:hypothetical protein